MSETPRSIGRTLLEDLASMSTGLFDRRNTRRESMFLEEARDARRQLLTPERIDTTLPAAPAAATAASAAHADSEVPVLPDVASPAVQPATLNFGGRELPILAKPNVDSDAMIGKLYDSTMRTTLTPEQLTEFRNSSTKFVLRKRLNVVSLSDTDEHVLENVSNLELQITAIREHLRVYDLDDVFKIVKPVDSIKTSALHPDSYNLFEDYVSLDPWVVANSTLYLHRWMGATHVRENLSLTYTFLKNNTDDTLWAKCLSQFEQFPVKAQGGPLMFVLLMRRIQNTTETALSHLVEMIKRIKLSTIEGENVEKVVLLVKAALKLVNRASKTDVVHLPLDFPKTLLDVYQTSSVPAFNHLFHRLVEEAQTSQYINGGNAQWPTLETINALAHNSYLSMMAAGTWNVPAAAAAEAYAASTRKGRRGKGAQANNAVASGPPRPPICWNCEGPHHSKDCPNPKNQALFDANKAKWQAARDARQSGSRPHHRPKHKVIDGKAMILNRLGKYVPDMAKVQQDKKKADLVEALTASLASLDSGTGPAQAPTQPPVAAPAGTSDRATRTRALLLEHLNRF